MSLYERDPFFEFLGNSINPWYQPLRRQPVRVHRVLRDDWPLSRPSFGQALSDLQDVMDCVNEAIGQHQTSLTKDLAVGGMKTNRTEDGNLQVAMDVSQFKPEEINVKLCDDNLVVEAKTESSADDSYHKAEFKRWVKLPQDVKREAIKSALTPDNKLVIEVPVNKPIADSRSRNIPIEVQKKPAVEANKDGSEQQTQAKSSK